MFNEEEEGIFASFKSVGGSTGSITVIKKPTPSTPTFHGDVLDYISRVELVGGSVNTAKLPLLNDSILELYSEGLRVTTGTNILKYWLQLNLTTSFTGCLIPVYDDGVGAATNNNFVSGDWSATNGLTGNGSNKYLDSGWNPDTKLGTFSNGGRYDVHFASKVINHNVTGSSSYRGVMGGGGRFDNTLEIYTLDNDNIISFFMTNGIELFISNTPAGVVLSNRQTSGGLRFLYNGTLADSTSSIYSPITSPNYNVTFFAVNEGGAIAHSLATMSSFTMGFGLTETQETTLYNVLNSL